MTTEQKANIEIAIRNLTDAARDYEKWYQTGVCLGGKDHQRELLKLNKAQNALYDAIGGMEDYKFEL